MTIEIEGKIEKESNRMYTLSMGLQKFLVQIIDEDKYIKFESLKNNKRFREKIISFEPTKPFIRVKNIILLVPVKGGDAQMDYDDFQFGCNEMIINTNAITSINLLADDYAEDTLKALKGKRSGVIMNASNPNLDLTSRKGGSDGRI